MIFKQALLALSVTAGLAVSVGAAAQPAGRSGFGGFGGALAAAGLSSSQKQQIHQITQAAHTQNSTQYAQMRTLHQQIEQSLFSSGTVTMAQLMPLVQQEDTLRQQLEVSRIQTQLSIRNVMTAAQLAQAGTAEAQLASLHQQEQAISHPSGD